MVEEITLINLPAPFLEDQMSIYPLGLLNVATHMKVHGHTVRILDCAALPANNGHSLTYRLMKLFGDIESPTIGVSATTPQARFLPLLPMAKKRTAWAAAGGPHATMVSDEVLAMGYDTVVVGEAEGQTNWVAQGIFKLDPIEDLDALSFPDRTMVKNYHGSVPVMASRGCAWNCSFCSKPEIFKYRIHSPEYVIEELKTIKEEHIIFYDDTFTMDYTWVTRFCELIIKNGIRKSFRCSTRADRISPEIARLLKRVGFEEVCVGVESGSQEILDILKKRTTPGVNAGARRICAEAGLRFKAYIMVGSPGESFGTIQQTDNWLNENRPDSIGVYLFHPLPGSDIWKRRCNYDIAFDSSDFDFTHYGGKREEMISSVSTSALSKRDLTLAYWKLLEKWGQPQC